MPIKPSYGYSIVIIVFSLIVSCSPKDKNVIAWVDDYPIVINEFNHWMLLQRAEVHNYFYRSYKIADSEEFWETNIGGESPLEMLKNLALEKAVRCKVQQILALENGVVDHIDFEQMMLEMQEENLQRKKKIDKGEVVYGAKVYTERSYFAHEFDKMLIQLKPELLKDEMKPRERDLAALIKNEDFPLEDNRGFYQLQYVEENYERFIDSLVNTAEIITNKKNWHSIHAFFK